jgi:hypothetical protein
LFFVFLGLCVADLAYLVTWLVLGFQVNGDPALAQRHQLGGLMVAILTVFTHSVTFVYFLGTGLAVKEAVKNWGISLDFVRQTRAFKLKAYPIAMTAIGFIIATGILGGAAASKSVPLVVHLVLAMLAIATSIAAQVVALRFMLRNGFMLALIRGEVAEIRAAAARGEAVADASGRTPELLRPAGEVQKAPRGFLAARACFFLALSVWGVFVYFWVQHTSNGKWNELPTVGWIPFAAISLPLLIAAIYLKIRHPLPSGVDF